MKLFHETENKYYEALSYLLCQMKRYDIREIRSFLEEQLVGEVDFEVAETLFSEKEDEGNVFRYAEGGFEPALDKPFPIRCTAIERQAARNMCKTGYEEQFLKKETLEKLRTAVEKITPDWDLEDFLIRNQYRNGTTQTPEKYEKGLRIISKAIRNKTAIVYDNVKEGVFTHYQCLAFPVKIEYSFISDRYWICAYEPKEKRYFKLNLDTVSRVEEVQQQQPEEMGDYVEFLKCSTRKAVLDVEPTRHVIERCFRIFSYYERQAVYDGGEKKYRLEITYSAAEEKAVIRDILSLGSRVTVLEPESLQREVYRRICKAAEKTV